MKSYGTGSVVKLPGSGPNDPNVYTFDTTYEEMYQDLYHKNAQLYLFNLSVMLPHYPLSGRMLHVACETTFYPV